MRADMDNSVSAVKVGEYNAAELVAAIGRHFDALKIWDDLKPGMRVLLKPNLLARRAPEQGITTHPALAEAVAVLLREHGVHDITLADSPGGPYTGPLLEGLYKGTGMAGAAERAGFRLNTGDGWREVPCPVAGPCRSYSLIEPVLEADFVINLPKLKTHAMTTLSAGVKNLFGCVPGLQKPELHFRFPDKEVFAGMLVGLARTVRPGVTLVDAVVSMEGDGPSGGELRHTGMTFAARNVFALDLALCEYIGLRPEEVGTVSQSVAAGLCPSEAGGIDWLCDGRPEPVAGFRHPSTKPLSFTGHIPGLFARPAEWLENKLLSPRPAVRRRKCIGCGKCAESCAPRAMTMEGGRAVLDLEQCIRCYCCHEMCPVKAVEIRRFRLLNH